MVNVVLKDNCSNVLASQGTPNPSNGQIDFEMIVRKKVVEFKPTSEGELRIPFKLGKTANATGQFDVPRGNMLQDPGHWKEILKIFLDKSGINCHSTKTLVVMVKRC